MNYRLPLTIAAIAGALSTSFYFHPIKSLAKAEAPRPAKDFCVYLIYEGIGPQNEFGSYEQTQDVPTFCNGHDALCFFRVCADVDGTITETEFNAAFDALDTNDDGSLDDETEQPGILEKLTLTK